MGRGRFLAYTTVGSAIWNSTLIVAGWVLGAAYEQASGVVGTLSVVAVAAAVLGLLVLWWRLQRKPGRQVLDDDGEVDLDESPTERG